MRGKGERRSRRDGTWFIITAPLRNNAMLIAACDWTAAGAHSGSRPICTHHHQRIVVCWCSR